MNSKLSAIALTADQRDEYNDAFAEGQDDAVYGEIHNEYPKGTPGWYGYNDGVISSDVELPAEQVVNDTAVVFHCDDFGTGEGRFHGRM